MALCKEKKNVSVSWSPALYLTNSIDISDFSRGLHTGVTCQTSKMAPVSSPMEVVENYIKNNKVMVFSKTTCPFCTKIKQLFDSQGFKYEVLELDQTGKIFFNC